jgi:hypothetical protein
MNDPSLTAHPVWRNPCLQKQHMLVTAVKHVRRAPWARFHKLAPVW